ncbi:MAG TPA: ABC-F family ATP-binding cassette domain-containing protein [Candidatus Latescibacteria bacterium]|jgi:ATPase subunit of ABC transporter with duplicated ATPase domains|nr:ABC-F family ATPase [Gemmatimonadota bacterium]MDP7362701.1 ABC-F family ATP-binding cassette domain-containing protein [Candidatus Latescibacterota bacterium]HJN27750.1 ABC-F family ATP-binding cassette domain-containing protein [Candidatus Latescibacterota bacterium]|tara:strand:- start:1506 stop:3452 length:1947 start_codon:yes stop_codon:yes gene_type:complete
MISISDLSKTYGDRTLFSDFSVQLNAGERYGLVGANGSGKTTLLNILTGDLEASSGKVAIPRRLRLGVLRQDQFLYEDHSILAVTLMGHQDLWKVMVEKEKLLAKAETHFDADRFSELEELVERYDGYSAEARASMILEGLGLPSSIHHDPLSTLSGGFKLRVLLAQVLASEPDALLLDEPTNHLDILSIRWLETFLRDFAGPLVVISHDHRFLDNVVTHILDVDYETVTLYHGNYTRFVDSKKTERSRREKDIAARERDIAEHQKTVDRFRAKASKARQAQSKEKMLEKMADSIEDLAPSSRRYPNFKFTQVRDSGRDVLTVKGVKKAFDDNEVLHGVDLQLQRGDRMAIMGPNGIGKSTLLKIIMDDLAADEGTVEWGYETHPGYFAQDHREQFDSPNNTAEGWIWGFCADQSIGYVRGNLGMVLFSGDDVEKRLGDLSGGEAARLIFAKLAIAQPNVLVLDEPTNHLDLESIEALVEGLQVFPGTLILVSHDRWFVSQLATRIVEIRPDDIHDYHGTYEEYVHFCGDDHLDADRVVLKAKNEKRRKKEEKTSDDASKKGSAKNRSKGNSKASRKRDQKQQEALLTRIEDAETRMKEIDETLCTPGFYADTPADDVRELERERAHLERDVAEWTTEWERAEETASR